MSEQQPWIPLEDWQRAVINQVAEARRYHAVQYARHRPRFVMANLTPYQEMFRRFAADFISLDQCSHDPTPDRCWRCDASPGADDLGLCEPCKASLTRENP